MVESDLSDTQSAEALSALMDGELLPEAVAGACDAWRWRESARVDWHAYHLIGDVLRSDDLASSGSHDAVFLSALRQRLASEPVVLAPPGRDDERDFGANGITNRGTSEITSGDSAKPVRPVSPRWFWVAPSAVAASFVAVASVLLLPGLNQDQASLNAGAAAGSQSVSVSTRGMALDTRPDSSAAALAGGSSANGAEPPALVANGQLIRDARLDRYLAAHKQFSSTSALGVPSGFLRNAATDVPNR